MIDMPDTTYELNPIIVFNQFDDASLLLEEEFDEWNDEDILTMLRAWQKIPEIRQKFADFPMRLWRKIAKKNTRFEEVDSSVFERILQHNDIQECCLQLVLLSLKRWQGVNLIHCLDNLRRDLDEKFEVCCAVEERAKCSSMINKISALLNEKVFETAEEPHQENSQISSEHLSAIARHNSFFESYEHRVSEISSKKFEFSPNQKVSIIMDDQYCLLRSSAGSGKTEVLIARFFFLVKECKINPKDILLLVYTKDVCNEINEKIKMRWDDDKDYERRWPEALAAQGKKPGPAMTFHAMALKIIKEGIKRMPTILTPVAPVENKKKVDHDGRIHALKNKLLEKHKQLLNNIVSVPYDEEPDDTIELPEHPNRYVIRKQSGEIVGLRSNAEVWIMYYYLKNGISVEYEKEFLVESEKENRVYRPDFSFNQNGQTYIHEHFATLNENNPDEGWKKYVGRAKEKIANYSKVLGSRFIYTVGEDESGRVYKREEILNNLEKELDIRGIIRSTDNDYIKKDQEYLKDSSDAYIEKFLDLREMIIEGRKDMGEISARMEDRGGFPKTFWNDVYLPLEECYKGLLRKPDHYYTDFSDSLDWATNILETSQFERALYKVILVDEYQDITPKRFSLLQALISQGLGKTQLFAVGDDWQSIYSFAGSDLRLFWDFENKWEGKGVCYDLYETFRFGKPLVQLSSSFVMTDTNLTQREIKGIRTPTKVWWRPVCPHPLRTLNSAKDKDDSRTYCNRQFDEIQKILSHIKEPKESCSVAILSRNNWTYEVIEDSIRSLKGKITWIDTIVPSTIHASKGQTFDYVFVLSCDEGTIPSRKRANELKRLVMWGDKEKEREERRLFYVALTRAKKAVYLLYNEDNPSRYIEEIKSSGLADYCQI